MLINNFKFIKQNRTIFNDKTKKIILYYFQSTTSLTTTEDNNSSEQKPESNTTNTDTKKLEIIENGNQEFISTVPTKSQLYKDQYNPEMIKKRDDYLFQILSENGVEIELKKVEPPKSEEEIQEELLEEQIRLQGGVIGEESGKTKEKATEAGEQIRGEEEEEEEEESKIIETIADKDIGFSELGGYNITTATGLLDEQPMKLHPTRQFFPGQVYNPEELHPRGRERDTRFRKRGRAGARHHYPNDEVNKKADFKKLDFLNNYVSDAGQLMTRKETQLKAKIHRKLMRNVKLARSLALLPYIGRREEFVLRPRRMEEEDIFKA